MEAGGGRGRRRISSREASPERTRLGYSHQHQPLQQRFARPLRKLQVVYYLSRNGQLEHPHFIELPYLPNQNLRLRDVMERLTLLRGRGMPSLFSWSCKRSYKNGYVWNDLAENDVIYPADGVEYVLKGSEIIPGAYDRFQHVSGSSRQLKALPAASHKLHLGLVDDEEDEGELVEEEGTMEEEPRAGKRTAGVKTNANGGRYSRSSRGALTDELERVDTQAPTRTPRNHHHHHHHGPTELPLDDYSPPSSTSSDKPPTHAPGSSSQRFDDADPAPEPGLTRNSVLLQIIACGSAALRGRSSPGGGAIKSATTAAASTSSAVAPGGCGRIDRGAVSRLASRAAEQAYAMRCAEENPRLCHPLVEDKEYFSGSIVEGSRGGGGGPQPALKKSSSYNEERSSKLGIGGEQCTEEERGGEVKGKCIPGRRKPSGKQLQKSPKRVL